MIDPASLLDLNGSDDGTGSFLAYTENDTELRIAPVAELYNWDSHDFNVEHA